MDPAAIREALLENLRGVSADPQSGGSFQSHTFIDRTARGLGIGTHGDRDIEDQQALLDAFHDLLVEKVIGWGFNLDNSAPPFLHIRPEGREVVEHLSRDPANPGGYMASIRPALAGRPIAESYIYEAVQAYNARLFKSSAVMLGCAAEDLAHALRDAVVAHIEASGVGVPTALKRWQIKTVQDELARILDSEKGRMDRMLREKYEAFWSSMAGFTRMTRNDAGHPKDVAPVTREVVHSQLLLFPELVRLTQDLCAWVSSGM